MHNANTNDTNITKRKTTQIAINNASFGKKKTKRILNDIKICQSIVQTEILPLFVNNVQWCVYDVHVVYANNLMNHCATTNKYVCSLAAI